MSDEQQPRRLRAYKFALDPTQGQLDQLAMHAGAARWAFNHALASKFEAWRRRQLQIDELVTLGYTEPQARREATVKVPSRATIQKEWNRIKGDVTVGVGGICPWWREVSTYAFQSAFIDADRAWDNWVSSLTGRRAGRRVGAPRFKSKHRSRLSFRLHHDVKAPTIRLVTYRRLRVPRIGEIRLHESGKRMARALARGGVVQSVTISRGGHRWYASVLVSEPDITPGRETQVGPSPRQRAAGPVGVDLGVRHLAALSTGDPIENPHHLRRARRRLLKAQRALSRRRGRDRRNPQRRPSKRWLRAQARVARLHHEVAARRASYLHAITKTLATKYSGIAIEDLSVAGMTRSACGTIDQPGKGVKAKAGLNRSILDASPGEFRRQLEYKASWYGSAVDVIDRWAPTSKTCSACGAVKAKLSLAERVFVCDGCGMVLDRDVNAARNILALSAFSAAPGRGEALNARGGDVSPSATAAVPKEAGRPGSRSSWGSDPPDAPKTA